MPRRIQTFEGGIGLDGWNLASSIGAGIMGIGLVLLLYNLINTLIRGPKAPADPWDGRTLEWATSSPPPAYNFLVTPRSEEHTSDSSHVAISYAVFCLKKKNTQNKR